MPKRPREDDPNSRVVLTKALRSSIEQKDAPSIIRALNRFSETQHRSANVKEFTMAINACLSFGNADSVDYARRVSEMMQQRFSDPKEWGEQGYSSLIRLTCTIGGEEGLENAMNMLRGMQAAKLLKKRSVGPILRLCAQLLEQEGTNEQRPDSPVPGLCVEAFERAQTANLELGVEEFANLFDACARLQPTRNLFLMRVFQALQDQMPIVPAELREHIQGCMEAACAGVEGAMVETCEASGEGVCQGVPLEKLPILECERDGLLQEIVKLVPEGQREEFSKFTAWVAEQGGFDAVVDGANLGYSGMSKWGAEARDRRAEWKKGPKKAKKSPLTTSAFNVVKGLVFKACSMAVQALESLTKFALPKHYYSDPLLEGGSVPPPSSSSKPAQPPPEVVAMMSEGQSETAKMEKRRVTVGTPLRLDFLEKAVDALREKDVEGSEVGSVFVVLNARHLQLERVEEQYHPVIERLKQKCHLWTSPRGVNDDLFWMYAGIYSLLRKGAWVLTNDQMRDHKFRMLYPRCFPRWYDQNFLKYTLSGVHQLNIGIDDISLFLHPPKPYATCPQMYGIGEETIRRMEKKLPEAGIQKGVVDELKEVSDDWPTLWRIPLAKEKGASTQWICAKFA